MLDSGTHTTPLQGRQMNTAAAGESESEYILWKESKNSRGEETKVNQSERMPGSVSLWRWHLSEVLKLGQGVHGYVGQEQWEHHASHACGSFVSRNKAVPREKVRKQDEHSLPRIQKSGQAGPLERVTESSRSGLGSIWFSFLWKLIPFSLTKKKIKWILLYYTNNYQLTKTHTVLISEIYALC